jgi:uncharacterized protein
VPVFKPLEDEKTKAKLDSARKNQPNFKAPRKKWRNFTAKINEYHNFILSANPVAAVIHRFPVSIEYYTQERLGYEFSCMLFRDPFFKSHSALPANTESRGGFSLYLKQKLYNKDNDNGMIYYAQEVRYTQMNYHVTRDSSGVQTALDATEWKYEFSLLIGDRLIKDPKKKGWTLDIFGGLGVGYRNVSKHYQSTPKLDSFLPHLKDSRITIPVRFGFMFGYLLSKKKMRER